MYMHALEGTNGWADLLAAIGGSARNGAVMDRMTRVSVREMVNAYFRRPTTPSPAPSPSPHRCTARLLAPLWSPTVRLPAAGVLVLQAACKGGVKPSQGDGWRVSTDCIDRLRALHSGLYTNKQTTCFGFFCWPVYTTCGALSGSCARCMLQAAFPEGAVVGAVASRCASPIRRALPQHAGHAQLQWQQPCAGASA